GASALLADSAGEARILAGGTDLLVQMRSDIVDPALIVDIKRIAETRRVTEEKGGGWRIGAAVTGAELKEHPRLKQVWPGVVEAANLIGSTQVQGRATLGGNLCNGSPAADSVPALIAAGAVATVAGPQGMRDIPVEDVMLGPRKLALRKGEIVVSFLLPPRRQVPRVSRSTTNEGQWNSASTSRACWRAARRRSRSTERGHADGQAPCRSDGERGRGRVPLRDGGDAARRASRHVAAHRQQGRLRLRRLRRVQRHAGRPVGLLVPRAGLRGWRTEDRNDRGDGEGRGAPPAAAAVPGERRAPVRHLYAGLPRGVESLARENA